MGELLGQSAEKELTTDVRVLPTVSMGKGHLTEDLQTLKSLSLISGHAIQITN